MFGLTTTEAVYIAHRRDLIDVPIARARVTSTLSPIGGFRPFSNYYRSESYLLWAFSASS
jgi:hypothetical protein